jgi:cytochrome d ubiquinol oxidase subunit I
MLGTVTVLAVSSQLLPAREQMAFTLGFHIVFAALGIGFPAITLAANAIGVRRGDEVALTLARRWSKAMAVLFAVGAVTGTVLSFEMGLLWPGLMRRFGDVFGIPFAIEGIFFFLEAIFIAVYLYGWTRMSPRAHLWSGVPIVIAGIGGALSVVSANAWMNQPGGFDLDAAGHVTAVRPLQVIFNRAVPYEVPHMILAAYMVAGFLVASVYAVGWLRGRRDRYHRVGFAIPFVLAAVATPVQIYVGDVAARGIAHDQPAKFASVEYVTKTGPRQPEVLGGLLIDGQVKLGIEVPDANSLLVGFSRDTVVTGLDRIPGDQQPPAPTLLHLAFQTMVAIGTLLLGLGAWLAVVWWRRRTLPASIWFWRAAAGAGAAAVLALECGWVVTEVGRQPWIVYQHMRTAEAVTGAHGLWLSLGIVLVLYTALGIGTVAALRAMARRWRAGDESESAAPYGPEPIGTAS